MWEKKRGSDIPVELFVLRVSSIIRGTKGEQHDVTPGGLLEESATPYFKAYLLLHHFGVHVGDEADGELADDLSGDNGLGSCFRERSLDTMKRQRRIPPASERLRIPAVVEVSRLDVEMAVDAHGLLGRV
ncbi:hypothetical protein EYF80_042393 [Liparis tanakae]|uniref:Uncharacterized protein n=1 Tax=Liparis tanakae TaxID=230148 RepID=A0A4Z2G2L0_9TELE|nr:hypothetical protein EYF80_042393 [Liparis tanakae]